MMFIKCLWQNPIVFLTFGLSTRRLPPLQSSTPVGAAVLLPKSVEATRHAQRGAPADSPQSSSTSRALPQTRPWRLCLASCGPDSLELEHIAPCVAQARMTLGHGEPLTTSPKFTSSSATMRLSHGEACHRLGPSTLILGHGGPRPGGSPCACSVNMEEE